MQSVNYGEFEERFLRLSFLEGKGRYLAVPRCNELKVCETQEEVAKFHEQWGSESDESKCKGFNREDKARFE